MAQLEFELPDFLQNNSAEEIHERMMNNLPGDIDNMPGGFPYDFTMPAANEKEELINFHLMRVLMLAFPQYAWDDWLDLHGQQVHLTRHDPQQAEGKVTIEGEAGTEIPAGTVLCTPATNTESPSLNFETVEDAEIPEEGIVTLAVVSQEGGKKYNVARGTITLMEEPIKGIISVINESETSGGTDRETNDDFYDRIAAEYDNSLTFLGNDSDYVRWSKAAGAGDCIVIDADELGEPGVVKLALVDQNGQPATDELIETVYDYIVSPEDRSQRLLPTACAELRCVAATTKTVNYTLTGLLYDDTTSIEQIKADFIAAVKVVYSVAKDECLLRYNDVRPLISAIPGVEDFEMFLMDGEITNIVLDKMEYPETGTLNFS